jgi:hypothetical protein
MYVYQKDDDSEYSLSSVVNDALGHMVGELELYEGEYTPEIIHNLMTKSVSGLPENYSVRFT